MNRPRPIYDKAGKVTGYKQEVKWRGQRRYFTRRTYAAAEACWARAIEDFEQGREPYGRYRQAPPADDQMTLAQWLATWREGRRLTPGVAYNQGKILDLHIIPALGHVPVAELTRLRVQRWVWALEDDYSPRYVRAIYGVLRLALLDAVDEPGVPVTASPCVRIRMEPPDPTGREALTPEQVAAVATHCRHEVLVWTLAFTGARIGELLKRDISDWSPFRGIVIAGRAEEPRAGTARKRGTKKARASKTAAGARVIPLCASNAALVRDHAAGRATGPLFANAAGGRPSYHAAYRAILAAAGRARRAGVDIPEGFSPHWLRVTHRTWLSEAGIPRVAVDERLGHATPGMQGVYERVTPAMRAAACAELEGRWRQAHGLPPAGQETGS